MRLMASFFRAYRIQTLLMLLALLLSGIAEGIGLSALLPLLNIALGSLDGSGKFGPRAISSTATKSSTISLVGRCVRLAL